MTVENTPVPDEPQPAGLKQLLDGTDMGAALESDRFKQFLDHIPIAIAVAELQPAEHIVYGNIEFERLTGQAMSETVGKTWNIVAAAPVSTPGGPALGDAITSGDDFIGAFTLDRDGNTIIVDAWSNVILDENEKPAFRLVALAEAGRRVEAEETALVQLVREKDTLLRELQHRVTNNLQMVTALIRLESRSIPDDSTTARFGRLAGRIEALGLLYRSLSETKDSATIDLGIYLSEIASAVMRAHAVEGIHLDLQVDTWPVSVNVAMPAGLVVNELLTNALKHAFAGRPGGTISLHSLVDETGCRVIIADDGIGLAPGVVWPKPGKLSAMIVQSLRQNAKARLEVESAPNQGMRVTIFFERSNAVS